MTTATCIYCGALKFGAFAPCYECDRNPTERSDVVRSLILTDHHFTHEELSVFGDQIKNGITPNVDAELERSISAEIDDSTLDMLATMSDPAHREYYRKRERNIICIIMAAIIGGIVWMLYRFAVG